ncbi:helix-turn-helix transcriptional regulator [Mycobacterium sp. 1245111.1]|uniref:helix-turn-helix domain-containing protein n=1 Tax=Mycobacterium sp. 1245111.1 TaxID=1834073 RepID=UPI000AF3C4EC|nr:helix-turn-helix transcriptional regulator [Mycobacterium sp. 1245111.1]
MAGRGSILASVMSETRTSQSELSRLSGVHQPSISQYLSGKVDLSDELLERLLGCMGYRLEVTRQSLPAGLTRSERRSWLLHRELAKLVTPEALVQWQPVIDDNVGRLRAGTNGQPHARNLERWATLIKDGDTAGLKRVLTGLRREDIEMREVSPMAGLLPEEQRQRVLRSQR